jgi:hypothetical protein
MVEMQEHKGSTKCNRKPNCMEEARPLQSLGRPPCDRMSHHCLGVLTIPVVQERKVLQLGPHVARSFLKLKHIHDAVHVISFR